MDMRRLEVLFPHHTHPAPKPGKHIPNYGADTGELIGKYLDIN
jgi:hypothetical protein